MPASLPTTIAMKAYRGRSLSTYISALFALILLQTTLWPALVSSERAFDALPYHNHLYLHPHAHTSHDVHEETHSDHLPETASAPWSEALGEGALCLFNLFATQFMGILIPENLNALVAAQATYAFLIPHRTEQQVVTALYLPLPEQPPRS